MTPYITYILVIIEILLVVSYIYLPSFLKKRINSNDAIVLYDKPYYINTGHEKIIATGDDLMIGGIFPNGEINTLNAESLFNKNYAFSMWVNINPQGLSPETEIVLFRYGYDTGVGNYKPKITYTYNEKIKKDVYRVYFTAESEHTNDANIMYEIHVPNQRWNHFVVNYVNGNMAELWINGVMERVMSFGKNMMPIYDPADQVIIGNKSSSGVNGAICGVKYFRKSLGEYQIRNIYNLGVIAKPYPT